MAAPPLRKPDHKGGTQVRICGRPIRKSNVICTFPYRHHPPNVHATVAIADDNCVVAIIDDQSQNDEDRGVEMWLLVEAPE